jgi:hypothetical protein
MTSIERRPSTPWCGRDDVHRKHGACKGVKYVATCGIAWSEHPKTLQGEPFCTAWDCPGSKSQKGSEQ